MSPRQATTPSIGLRDIAVVRGSRTVLDGFSLEATVGNIIWVRGANGSGKSTLLRLVAGLLPAARGAMNVDGAVALADENLALDPNQSLNGALGFWKALDHASDGTREHALIAMDLITLADMPVRYLSTGQRKRANLSRLLASGSPIWLLDEPYNGLDSASAARLDEALLKHASAGGIALVAAHQAPSINVSESILLKRLASAA